MVKQKSKSKGVSSTFLNGYKKNYCLKLYPGKVIAMSMYMDYLVQKEKYQDLIREAEQDRLLQIAKLQKAGQWRLHRNLAAWIGIQMVKWGSRLQHYGSVSAAAASTSTAHTKYLTN